MNEDKQCTIPAVVLTATLKVLESYRNRLGREVEIMGHTPDLENRVEEHRKLIEVVQQLVVFYSSLTAKEG